MGIGFTTERRNGVLCLKGGIDEASDFEPLTAVADPVLKLNLGGIQTINSLGLRRLIVFFRALGGRDVELHDCPPVFIEAVNVMPLSIGGPQYIRRIASLLLPFHCRADHDAAYSIRLDDIKISGDNVDLPRPPCAKCGAPMDPDLETDLDEFFFFLSN